MRFDRQHFKESGSLRQESDIQRKVHNNSLPGKVLCRHTRMNTCTHTRVSTHIKRALWQNYSTHEDMDGYKFVHYLLFNRIGTGTLLHKKEDFTYHQDAPSF